MTIVALCAAIAPAAGARAATFTGQLQELHGHRLDGTMVDESWRVIDGSAEHSLSDPQPAGLVGETVTITDGDPQTKVVEGRARAAPISRAAADAPAGGPQSVLVLIITTPDSTTPAGDPASVRQAIFTAPDSANAFYQQQSDGATSLKGLVNPAGDVAQVAVSQPLRGCDYRALGSAARAAADQQGWNTGAYDHRIYLHPKSADCDYSGRGAMPGNDVWSNGNVGWYVISHELGHNMGAHHANVLDCTEAGLPVPLSGTCTNTEYADPFDVMGRGGLMSAWHRRQVGQLATQTASLRQSASLTLSPADGPPTGLQSVLVPIKVAHVPVTRWYALDLRSARAPFNPFAAGAAVTTGITIRIVPAIDERIQTQLIDTDPSVSRSHANAPLQPGATFTDAPHAIAIHARAQGGVDVTMPALVDDVPPSAVGFLDAGGDTNGVLLGWGAASDDESVDHYDVVRDGTTIGSTAGLSLTDSATSGLASAVYEVVAVDPTGNRGPAVRRQIDLRDLTPPSAVGAMTASASPAGVALSWSAASDNRGVTAYWVRRDSAFVATLTATSFGEQPAAGGHRYTVEAIDAAGNHGEAAAADVTMPGPVAGPGTGTGPAGPSTTTTITDEDPALSAAPSARGAVIKVASRRTRRLSGGRRRLTITYTCGRASTMRVYLGSRRAAIGRGGRVQVTFTLARRQQRSVRVRADFGDGYVTRRLAYR
jgi:chitodextrinase